MPTLENDQMMDLVTLAGNFSMVPDMNSRGQVVGRNSKDIYWTHAFQRESSRKPIAPHYAALFNQPKTTRITFTFGILSVELMFGIARVGGRLTGFLNRRVQ